MADLCESILHYKQIMQQAQRVPRPPPRSFKLKVKRVAYKFGGFVHWVFFKPESQMAAGEDPAQTSRVNNNYRFEHLNVVTYIDMH